jgi:hypothetical protein
VPLQILERTVSIHTMKDGNMDECLLEEVVAYRQFTMQEVDLLATLTGMQVRRMPFEHSGLCHCGSTLEQPACTRCCRSTWWCSLYVTIEDNSAALVLVLLLGMLGQKYKCCQPSFCCVLLLLLPLQVVGVYGDLDLNVSLNHEDAFRLVMCLRKQ